MNKKLLFITIFGLYIPLTTLTSEKSHHQTTKNYSIRDFNPEQDTHQVTDIFNKDRQWLSPNTSSSLYQSYLLNCKKPTCNIKVLRENEKVAGYVMYKKNYWNQGDIAQFAVSDNFRNKGYGKLLVSTAIEELKNMNTNSINLYCYGDNTPALNLYKKMGFYKQRNFDDFIELTYNPALTHTDVPEKLPTDIFQQPWDL